VLILVVGVSVSNQLYQDLLMTSDKDEFPSIINALQR